MWRIDENRFNRCRNRVDHKGPFSQARLWQEMGRGWDLELSTAERIQETTSVSCLRERQGKLRKTMMIIDQPSIFDGALP